ncbi:MAG: hypothetical protein EBU46_00180 [Nitrosomonadaceae bacterium]|nr:hypothetical protein [Nitrosomonadaceae bacterium]
MKTETKDERRIQLIQWVAVELMKWPLTNDDNYTATSETLTHRLNAIVYVGVAYHMRFAPEATPYARTWHCFDPYNNPRDFRLLLMRLTEVLGDVSFRSNGEGLFHAAVGDDYTTITTGYENPSEALMELASALCIRLTEQPLGHNPRSIQLKVTLQYLTSVKFPDEKA